MNFFSYWFSDRIVLRMYRAREITPGEHPELYETVREIAGRAGLPMPRIALIPERAPNAFATGRNPAHAVVAVTEGLLELMGREEVKGVLAHEMAHVKNQDILIGSVAATMAGAVMILANLMRWSALLGGGSDEDEGGPGVLGLLAISILAPLAAMLIQMAISRAREYQADATGAAFAGDPEGLAKALEKLGAYSHRIPLPAQANTAHMFIVNPLGGGRLAGLFSTHPPLEERIARLRKRGHTQGPLEQDGEAGRRAAEASWKRLSG
jgi:heat shock protein HtpX